MTKLKTQSLLFLVVPAFVFIVAVWLSLLLIERQLYVWQRSESIKLLDEVDQISLEVSDTLVTLNGLSDLQAGCGEDRLITMRRELFLNPYVRDIGYLEDDQLICTTGIGILKNPLPSSVPDFIGRLGNKIFTSVDLELFEGHYSGMVIQREQYNVVFDVAFLEKMIAPGVSWQIVNKINDINYVSGKRNLFVSDAEEEHFKTNRGYQSQMCSKMTDYCVAVNTDWAEYQNRYKVSIMMLMIISLGVAVFSWMELGRFIRRRNRLDNRVRRGLKRGRFYGLYQPLVRLEDQKIVGCEVLARFEDSLGPLYPDQFIPIVREQQLSWPFTQKLIENTLAAFAQTNLPDSFKINFNLFPSDIVNGHVRELVQSEVMIKNRFQIVFEITEDEQFDQRSARESIEWIKAQGYLLAIDDFGTGYSNLNHLKNLNCDELKIDRSFINDMEEGSIKSSLIPHIIEIARLLNLEIVAEGIENSMQQKALTDLGVEYGQGWAFGKPMTINNLLEKIGEHTHQ